MDKPDAGPPDSTGDGGVPGTPDSGMPGGDAGPGPIEPPPQVPDWVQTARVGGLTLDRYMDDEEVDELLRERKDENVSVLEIDTRLSFYLSEEEFEAEAAFLDRVARKAHDMGMRAVIYYPSLEVLTRDGETAESSMYKDHPDWIQMGLDGSPNVFYGSEEDWVEPGTESAWMSPNSGYRDYFLDRVRRLAQTSLDGVWLDVPLYLDTGTSWAGAEPPAQEAFRQWSIARGLGGVDGLSTPTELDIEDTTFRAWMWWRHENLADFLEDVRLAAQEANSDFMVIVEDFPMDYMDGAGTGLDGTLRRSGDHFIRVWEVDSVSNSLGMQWATIEDFSSKIAMYKWAAACEHENPPWSFVYGNEPLDASLVMAAAVATRNMPFEAKTPDMTESVGSAFRARWYGFIRDHEDALLRPRRMARVGVWFSSATRDFLDYSRGGRYGMYINQDAPTDDPDWWSLSDTDSATFNPHLGGWRGAAHALSLLHVPFKPITDPGAPAMSLREVKLLWLPSVIAISDESARIIRDFVDRGGVVVATGEKPGTLDALGRSRPDSVLADVFGFVSGEEGEARVHPFGDGLAVYRPDVRGKDLFALFGDAGTAARAMGVMEQLIRIHVPDVVRIEDAPPGVHVEVSRPQGDRQYLYLVNATGLQLPLVSAPLDLGVTYIPPAGKRVVSADIATPDEGGQTGTAAIERQSDGAYRIDLHVDQFALVEIALAPAETAAVPPYEGPSFATERRREAAESAMSFVLERMRDPDEPEPWSFGVHTNLLDTDDEVGIYPHGHNVTAEHMGLLLRASACMKDETAYRQAYRYVRDAMLSPTYHLVNWAIDSDARAPLVELDESTGAWLNANAPLDDLRVIRGLLAGPRQMGMPEAGRLARQMLRGLYWTTVTDRDGAGEFPDYPGGLLAFSWDWAERDDPALDPPAVATGLGYLGSYLIPIDYQDLYTIALAARGDGRWRSMLASATDLLLNAEIGRTGLFWNGLEREGGYTGDFENQDNVRGQHLKVIQELWIGLHLARIAGVEDDVLDPQRKQQALAAAERNLAFFRAFYEDHGRVPEYLTETGQDLPECQGDGTPPGCLDHDEYLLSGEARIYAQLARLALILGDHELAATVVEDEILTDWIDDPDDPRYGVIGASTAGDGDAEAWNILEPVLTLCQEAGGA